MKTLDQYRELIARTERLQATRPLLYSMRVAAFALLGIGYLVAMAMLALALGVALVIVLVVTKALALFKVAWIPIAFGLFLLKAICVRIPAPNGRMLEQREVPRLFGEIEGVRRALHARRIHAVILTPDFNAAIAQVPRLGILGWPKRYLILGLPLMASLPLEEFRAVLAHEFGHVARNHARFGNWIYRTRCMWYRLLAALETQRSSASTLFTWFFNWYAPYFEAYSFVLARANEYVADSESARVAGKEHAAGALLSVHSKTAYADSGFWEDFYRPASEHSDPPAAPFARFLTELRSVEGARLQSSLKVALARKTDLHDTHPCLADRLAALGESVRTPAPVSETAADLLLGPLAQTLIAEQDVAWSEAIAKGWRERHEQFQQAIERRATLQALMQERELTVQESLDYGLSLELLGERKAALPLLDSAIAAEPGNASAWYIRGRVRLAEGQDDGVADLGRAIDLDERATVPACQVLYRYLESRDELQRFEPYRSIYEAFVQKQNEAAQERRIVKATDRFAAHEMGASDVEKVAEAVRKHQSVRRAWLARKQLAHFPQDPLFILVLESRRIERFTRVTLPLVAKSLPAGIAFFVLNKARHDAIYKNVKKLPGALIYER
jgi:Zn-dependent protease with chaperone function